MPTFLFTDIEGSTELWARYPRAMEQALARHDSLLAGLIVHHGGQVVKHTGDGFFAVFAGGEPLACALALQQALAQVDWGELGELRVRAVLHAGAAQQRGADYFGLEVSRAARLLTAGWGGQILLSCELARAACLPAGAALRDLGNHQLKDLSEPQHIYQLLHPALPRRDFPPLRTLSARPHNLPAQPTPFVGRTRELREIAVQLADPACRLLTLLGPGGIGKTRLALQAGAAESEHFVHGVFFAPLESLESSDLLLAAIAEALGFTFYQRDTPRAQLLNYLQEKRLLLILDNFEHLIQGAELVVELLAHAPEVKILVTSRERLNVRGELILPVTGLDFPLAAEARPVEEYEAGQLFLQHAQRVVPAFTLDEGQQPCVARICTLVLGTPLALELAASWLRMLSCAEIAEELELSLDFLSSTLRDAPERHRSLRAVFDYSWRLLDPAEQVIFAALAAFQGSFHREAALTVLRAADPALNSVKLLHSLAGLVDKSLLQRQPNDRYALHPLLHQYAREKLEAVSAVATHIHQRHCEYYMTFLQQRQEDLSGLQQRAALTAIAEVLDNARAAWQWAVQQQQWALVVQGCPGLTYFFDLSGRYQEGVPLFEAALAALAPLETPEALALRGRLAAHTAMLLVHLMALDATQTLATAALELSQQTGDLGSLAAAHLALGRVAWYQNNSQAAAEHYRVALQCYTTVGDRPGQAESLNRLGSVAWALGDYAEARLHFERSLLLFRELGNLHGIAMTLDLLGVVARDTGDMETARAFFQESYASLTVLGTRMSLAYVANHLGGALAINGGLAEAKPYFEQCIAIGKELGEQRIVAYTSYDWGTILLASGDTTAARPRLETSVRLFAQLGDQFGLNLARAAMGDLALDNGELDAARQYYLSALREAITNHNLRLAAHALIGWGRYLLAAAEWVRAAEMLSLAQTLPQDTPEVAEKLATLLAEVRAQLTPEAYAAAAARGQAVDLAQFLQAEDN